MRFFVVALNESKQNATACKILYHLYYSQRYTDIPYATYNIVNCLKRSDTSFEANVYSFIHLDGALFIYDNRGNKTAYSEREKNLNIETNAKMHVEWEWMIVE